jgi:hypothetical protein
MKYEEASEIVFGLLLNKKIPPSAVVADHLFSAYGEGALYIQTHPEFTSADLIDKIGWATVSAADQAYAAVQGRPALEWIGVLEKAYTREVKASILEAESKKLRKGEDSNDGRILDVINKEFNGSGYVYLSEVEEGASIRVPTFYAPLDHYMANPQDFDQCGVPEAGLITIGAAPGTGKTSMLIKILGEAAKHGKKSLFYSLEMTNKQISQRFLEISNLTKEEKGRIKMCDRVLTPQQIRAEAHQICAQEDIYFIGVDFLDMMILGAADEGVVSSAYKELWALAKETKVPVFLISQLNRLGGQGVPKINDLRGSGLAEALSAAIILLYNPNQTFARGVASEDLPAYEGRAYAILGKDRFGFREKFPGAILIDFDGASAWGDVSYGYNFVSVKS